MFIGAKLWCPMVAHFVRGADEVDAWFCGHWLVAQAQRRELLTQFVCLLTLSCPSIALRVILEPILLTGSFATAPYNSG